MRIPTLRTEVRMPKGLQVHLILDNYGTHTHPNVIAWLAQHPRFHRHFTPTSSSWLNLVERWFRNLTDKAIRRGVFPSGPDLIAAIEAYLQAHNDDPKPFVWTATVNEILEKVRRGRVALTPAAIYNRDTKLGVIRLEPPVLVAPAHVRVVADLERLGNLTDALPLGDHPLPLPQLPDDLLWCVLPALHGSSWPGRP